MFLRAVQLDLRHTSLVSTMETDHTNVVCRKLPGDCMALTDRVQIEMTLPGRLSDKHAVKHAAGRPTRFSFASQRLCIVFHTATGLRIHPDNFPIT
jgi:hypothetical protein